MITPAHDAARGRWAEILVSYGIGANFLTNNHGPCPLCGGKDRYRWDNKDKRGTYYCSGCGAGDGFELLKKLTGKSYKELADEVRALLKVEPYTGTQRIDNDARHRARVFQRIWSESLEITPDDVAGKYLINRLGKFPELGKCVRLHPSLWHRFENKRWPAMVAKYASPEGKAMNIHCTFLGPDGDKAAIDHAKLVQRGSLPSGGAVRLGGPACEVMGIAEGIETALSASILYGVRTWAALNGNLLAKWQPPPECREVFIFADNDANYTGQAKAYQLANQLQIGGRKVNVLIPNRLDTDFNDVLRAGISA